MNEELDCIVKEERQHAWISRLFRVGMSWRIVYGAIKGVLGAALLQWVTFRSGGIIDQLVKNEIAEDPSDVFFHVARPFFEQLSIGTTAFIGAHLIFWGTIDVVLSIYLLKRRHWAFRVSLWLISVFVLYELYRVSHTHSLILAGVIVVDLFVLWLIYREYRLVQSCEI